jgi:hypothetical protein
MISLNFSDKVYQAGTVQKIDGHTFTPYALKGMWGDAWLNEFPVGPSSAPYSFKIWVDENGTIYKCAADRRERHDTWPIVRMRPIRYRGQIPSRYLVKIS